MPYFDDFSSKSIILTVAHWSQLISLWFVSGVCDTLFPSHAFLIVYVANKVVIKRVFTVVGARRCGLMIQAIHELATVLVIIKITVSVISIRLLHNTDAW